MAAKKTKRIKTTGNRNGFVVLVSGDDNPALLRRDQRGPGGYQRVKGWTSGGKQKGRRRGKCATTFTHEGTAANAGKDYAAAVFKKTELEIFYCVIPVGPEDTDHIAA